MENVLDLMSVGTQAYNSLSPLKFPFDRFVTMQLSFRNRVLRHRPLRSYCTSRIQLLTMTYATMILAHLWTFKCIMHVQYNTQYVESLTILRSLNHERVTSCDGQDDLMAMLDLTNTSNPAINSRNNQIGSSS